MNLPADLEEIYFLLDSAGSLVVYEEKHTSWLGVLAFSNEANAREFVNASKLDISDVVAIATTDTASIAGLIAQVKKRAVRNLLLDLDFKSGNCLIVEFEGDRFGPTRQWQFTPKKKQ